MYSIWCGALIALTLGAAGVAACSVPTGEVTRPGSCDPFRMVRVFPAHEQDGIPTNVRPEFWFSDFPDPGTIGIETIAITTGVYRYTSAYQVDLIDRKVIMIPSGGLPSGLGLTLTIRPKIRSLAGCTLPAPAPDEMGEVPETYTYRFRTAEPGTKTTIPTPVATEPTYADVSKIFARNCAGAACHLASVPDGTAARLVAARTAIIGAAPAPVDDGTCLATPAGHISLCARDTWSDLVGVPSTEVTRMVRVQPHDSSRSYLLRKLLGAPPTVGHKGPPGGSLSADELKSIARWIDLGAPN